MNPTDRKFYVQELKGNECRCGSWKRSRLTFCYLCWKKLPTDLQQDLYKEFGNGYEEAREAAEKFFSDGGSR